MVSLSRGPERTRTREGARGRPPRIGWTELLNWLYACAHDAERQWDEENSGPEFAELVWHGRQGTVSLRVLANGSAEIKRARAGLWDAIDGEVTSADAWLPPVFRKWLDELDIITC